VYAQSVKAPDIKSNEMAVHVQIDSASTQFLFDLNSDGQSYSIKAASTNISGALVMPSVHNSLPITTIPERGFEKCEKITSVTLPNALISIGEKAFLQCNFSSGFILNLPNTVISIGAYAFQYCHFYQVHFSNTIKMIENGAFTDPPMYPYFYSDVPTLGLNIFGNAKKILIKFLFFPNTTITGTLKLLPISLVST
jgi:hypothetical protein